MHNLAFLSTFLLASSTIVCARPAPTSPSQYGSATASRTESWKPTGSGHAVSNNGTQHSFKFSLHNGFPNPQNATVGAIEKQAQGTLPNGPPPPSLHPESETSLALIAFNELFEVAFFTELLHNITSSAPGYTASNIPDLNEVMSTLKVVQAQEELHELDANGAFTKFTGQTIQPCRYNFPVDTFHDAINLASTFTDVVLATLPDIQTVFAENDDNALIRGVGAVIGQEGEQNGFYRHLLDKLPPALPFLTAGARDFAFNAILQNFVIPGSCPSLDLLTSRGLSQFEVLNVLTTDFALKEITAEFSLGTAYPAENSSSGPGSSQKRKHVVSGRGASLTYINQQNIPVSVPINISATDNVTGAIRFTALFPGKTHDLNGLTIAAVTNSTGPFSSADDVAAATLFGPGLIEV